VHILNTFPCVAIAAVGLDPKIVPARIPVRNPDHGDATIYFSLRKRYQSIRELDNVQEVGVDCRVNMVLISGPEKRQVQDCEDTHCAWNWDPVIQV
jgi:hypothetical protein